MKTKPITPYARLKDTFTTFARSIIFTGSRSMFYFSRAALKKEGSSWSLDDVYERTLAAKQLGHEVIINADEQGMSIRYRKALPTELPWEIR